MTSPTERSRIATPVDAHEVAHLLDRFQAEFDEYTPGVEVLAPRVREHITGGLSVFLLAGPPNVGVAQLRFREYLLTGVPISYLEVRAPRHAAHGRVPQGRNMGPPRDEGHHQQPSQHGAEHTGHQRAGGDDERGDTECCTWRPSAAGRAAAGC